jgi:hypothetical protein
LYGIEKEYHPLHLVATYTKSPAPDAPNQVEAAVEHPTGQVVYFTGPDFDATGKLVDEFYDALVSSPTVDDFVSLLWPDDADVKRIDLPETPTLADVLSAFNPAAAFAEGSE